MSTRAIIAIPTKKGYKTAWCWSNGFPDCLGAKLRRYFKTEEEINELINLHSFSYIYSEREAEKRMKGFDLEYATNSSYVRLYNNAHVLMDEHDGKVVAGRGPYGFFKDIDEMLDQDLNYVYVFENGKWETYK